MSNRININDIPDEKFERYERTESIHDKKLDTKPIGYFKDAFIRFRKNKSSVVAAIIILILILYAILVPIFCENSYTLSLTDTTYLRYTKLEPKFEALSFLGWNGCTDKTVNKSTYLKYVAMEKETGISPIAKVYKADYVDASGNTKTTYYDISFDTYYGNSMFYETLTPEQYSDIQKWQNETGIQVIFPAVTQSKLPSAASFKTDASIWYLASQKGVPEVDKDGNFTDIYDRRVYDDAYDSIRIAGDDGSLNYALLSGDSQNISYRVRIHSYNYFIYRYGFEPAFVFGTNASGQDIFTRLASGARFSFLLAICVSAINLFIGAIYGAIEGYYGGMVDIVMERVTEVLGGIPFIVVTTLFQLHLAKVVGPVVALLFAFVLTGWIGMASSVRMQFYRFKGQEYVLAARTLGAKDRRLMFKHIFPNSLGTLITGSVLVIPGVIFSESSLTYLGIVNLESSTMTSVGTMLAAGKAYLSSNPYIIFFPAVFIALLEISFNLFGNGLRDAFNPSLRGTEE